MIDVIVVDDHPVVRDGVAAVLGTQDDLRVLASLERVEDVRANVVAPIVVLDWEMAGLSGVRAIAALRERIPDARIVIFSAYAGDERVSGAFAAGARAYVLKGSPADELLRAVRTIADGGTYVGRGVSLPIGTAPDHPTPRELDVLRYVAEGLTNAQIAARLNIAERTVKFHLQSLYARLGAKRRTEAIHVARERGLIPLR